MIRFKNILLICACLFYSTVQAQSQLKIVDSTQIINPNEACISCISFRGLSIPNNKTIWVSGSKGSVAVSTNGGKSFTLFKVPGYENNDFRSIYAFNHKKAIIVSTGSPGYILKTFDGGLSWRKVYENTDPNIFLDAIDFWDSKKGMVLGDPIEDRFMLLRTIDEGNTWYQMDTSMRPWAIPGESVFAASGTSFRCMPNNSIAFVTGGSKSVFHWLQIDKKYQRHELKAMIQGKSSEGAFSFDYNSQYIAIVGGDYASDTSKVKQGIYRYAYDKDGLQLLNMKPFYTTYKSCVGLLDKGNFISCGTQGVDLNNTEQLVTISNNKTLISPLPFHVVRKARKGKIVVMAGPRGSIGILQSP